MNPNFNLNLILFMTQPMNYSAAVPLSLFSVNCEDALYVFHLSFTSKPGKRQSCFPKEFRIGELARLVS